MSAGLRLWVCTLLLVWFATATVKGTAVIAIRTPERIVLAADSAAGVYPSADGERRSVPSGCKIRRAGRWWLLAGGFTGHPDRDARPALAQAIAAAETLPAALAALQAAWRRELLPDVQASQSLYRGRLYRDGLPISQVIVAGIDRGVLSVGLYGAWLQRREPFEVADGTATCPGRLCDDNAAPYLWGSSVDGPLVTLIGTPASARPAWLQRADAAAARRLIELQIAATPDRVGAPIDVLEVDADGRATWVQHDRASSCHGGSGDPD